MKLIVKYYYLKNQYPKALILIKSGVFYEALNDDAYIINYLFNYKIKQRSNYIMVGFPVNIIKKIEGQLLKQKISYVILNVDNQYIAHENPRSHRHYEVLLKKSKKSYWQQEEINKIYQRLITFKNSDNMEIIINRINEIVNEI
ncbi:MAG: hypothetical protein ACOXZW_01655 [Bacilli bacterium]|nr:hypothetical protein [Bacilli bacterium]